MTKIQVGDRVLLVDRASTYHYAVGTVTRTAPGTGQSRYWLDFGDGGHGVVAYERQLRKVVSQ